MIMKHITFIWAFIILSLALILANIIVLEVFSQQKLVPIDNFILHKKTAERNFREAKIIALGDSHIAYALNLNARGFLNLAFPSDNTIVMYAKLVHYYHRGMRPDLVLLQADYHLMTTYREKKDYSQYHDFMDDEVVREVERFYPDSKIRFRDDLFGFQLYQLRSDIAANIHKTFLYFLLQKQKGKLHKNVSENGLIANNGNWDALSEHQRQMETQKRIREQFVDSMNLKVPLKHFYEKIITFCQQHGIRVVLIRPPLSRIYRENLRPETVEEVDSYYRRLAAKNGLRVLDFRTVFDGRPEMFANQDHLKSSFSAGFSKMLSESLETTDNSVEKQRGE